MADYTFFTQPMSRGQIARWALHEAGADYWHELVDLGRQARRAARGQPDGQSASHHPPRPRGDQVVTEGAAICAYLAEIHPDADLLPDDDETADYFRWLFFAAGPLESAIMSAYARLRAQPRQEKHGGLGQLRAHDQHTRRPSRPQRLRLRQALHHGRCLCRQPARLGAEFRLGPAQRGLRRLCPALQARAAYKAAKAIDNALISEMRK